MVVKVYYDTTPILNFPVTFVYRPTAYHQRIVTFEAHCDFLIILPYKYFYLLTYLLFVNMSMAVLWKNTCKPHGVNYNFIRRPKML